MIPEFEVLIVCVAVLASSTGTLLLAWLCARSDRNYYEKLADEYSNKYHDAVARLNKMAAAVGKAIEQ